MKILKFLLVSSVFFSCLTDINQIKKKSVNNHSFETMEDVELFYSDSGIVKVKLIAPIIERFEGEKNEIIFPKGIDVTFYSDGTQIQSILKANYAIKNSKNNITEIKDNVFLQNNKSEKLNTEHLIWDEEKSILKSDKEVIITTEKEIIKGIGFEADQEFNYYKIKNITGTFMLKENEKNN